MNATEARIQKAIEQRNLAQGRFEKREQQVLELAAELERAQAELESYAIGWDRAAATVDRLKAEADG